MADKEASSQLANKTEPIHKIETYLEEPTVGVENRWQVSADIGVYRGLNMQVLKAHFNTRRMNPNPANITPA